MLNTYSKINPSNRGFTFITKVKGFTLIELMIAITILAVISSIGFVTYSNSQISARDGKRKQDLRSIATALELYYQTNKRYPCTGSNVWVTSSGGGNWIGDTEGASAVPTGCADSVKPLNSTYINIMPVDPKNTGNSGGFPWGGATNYFYAYRGYQNGGACATKNGQFYLLVAQLENKTDPDRQGIRKVKDCIDTGATTTLTSVTWDTTYVLSSE